MNYEFGVNKKPTSFSPIRSSDVIYSTDFDWRLAEGWALCQAWGDEVGNKVDVALSSWSLCLDAELNEQKTKYDRDHEAVKQQRIRSI